MPLSKDEAKAKLEELIEKHQRFKNEGRLKGINEETTKQWIDDLFRILGWDFIEDVVKEYGTGKRKRVDYAFQVTGTTKFLLEAKAYGEELEDKYIKQTLEYGYQNNKTWVVLTNFREIRVYNAKYYDKEEHIRRLYEPIRIEDVVVRIDDLWVLSRDGMKEGVINQLANKYGKIKPKEAIDSLIFEDLLRWRKSLEKGIREHERLNHLPTDPDAAEKYIDEAVQKILDRIIFVRVCEDRGLEEEELLRWCVREWKANKKYSLMSYLARLFSKKNSEYNSGIFATHYSETLTIENEALETIIEGSYVNPNGLTYDFSAIDADILGTIYENYLAYIQRRVWDKESKQKSKRKAQGIYYTPTYIVDYIVRNTLGEKLKACSKPEEALKIRVLDPACGSGSFLIRAYDEFKSWYTSYVKKNGEKQHTLNQELKGTTEFMDKVLENCIYGVDLDPKAVEIAQLNLLLKSAEGKHKLPTLNHTVQCGNSLIDDPAVAGERAFKWEEKVPEVFKDGGFDVVVGNPPYVYSREFIEQQEKDWFKLKYQSYEYQSDLYILFIERGLNLLKSKGELGYITPNSFFGNIRTINIRKIILDRCQIENVIYTQKDTFGNVNVETVVFILNKEKARAKTRVYEYAENEKLIDLFEVDQTNFKEENRFRFNFRFDTSVSKIIDKIKSRTENLQTFFDITRGVNAYDKYRGQSQAIIDSRAYHSDHKKDGTFVPEMKGKNVERYAIAWDGKSWISYGDWLAAPRDPKYFKGPRLVLRQIPGRTLISSYLESAFCIDQTVFIAKPKTDNSVFSKYCLGLINSTLMAFFFKLSHEELDEIFPKIKLEQFKTLPIKTDEGRIKPLVILIDKMLSMNNRLNEISNKTSNEAQTLKAEIEKTDKEIDRLVYEIYGLTEKEIKIVEEALK